MLKTVTSTLTTNISKLKSRSVFLILSVLSFALRFPFFFRDYIDRDESTFILMGQSWVDGHLPYTQLWDLKPPVTFLFFAGIIYVFGKSFLAIRLAGSLIVGVTGYFTYKIGEELQSKKVGLLSGVLCVLLLTMFGSLQGVMSEHICMIFFVPGLFFVLTRKKPFWLLISGLLMGLALMTKMNIAYAVLFCGLYIIYRSIKTKEGISGVFKTILFGTGIISVVSLAILPYYLHDLTNLWWKSVILAPLEYIGARRYSLLKLAPIFVALLIFFIGAYKKKWLDYKDMQIQLILAAILGVLFAFYKGGRINGHYLIQLHPMLIILVVIVISKIESIQKIKWRPIYFMFVLLLPMETYLELGNVVKNKIERGTFYNGEGFSVPKHIVENNLNTKNILFFGYHIGYWNLDTNPPTKSATHPSNISRAELFPFYDNPRKTSIDELQFIMDSIRPKTIVTRKNRRVFDKEETELNEYIDSYLETHYKVQATVEKAEILQRLE